MLVKPARGVSRVELQRKISQGDITPTETKREFRMNKLTQLKSNTIKTVDFYGKEIQTFLYKGVPWVSVNDIVAGLKIDARSQRAKLSKNKEMYGEPRLISSIASDGKTYQMLSIPLEKLTVFLLSINANKVREDLRKNLIQYQAECTQALNNYWFEGAAVNPRASSAEWQAQRAMGKIIRLSETDVIQKFVDYAMAQGSMNAGRYYGNITRMVYTGLQFISSYHDKCKELRDALDTDDTVILQYAELLVRDTIAECMEEGIHYKDIYIEAKNVVIAMHTFHKSTQRKKPLLSLVDSKKSANK